MDYENAIVNSGTSRLTNDPDLHEDGPGCCQQDLVHGAQRLAETTILVRSHSSTGWFGPASYAATFSPQLSQVAALSNGCDPWPVAGNRVWWESSSFRMTIRMPLPKLC